MEYSKLIRINEYLNIEESELKKVGIYNGYVFLDSPLFLNPKLLDNNDIPEFYDAENIIVLHFENTIKILKNVKEYSDKDVWWRMAKKHFYFPEPEGIGLGTSIDSIDGNGLTGKTAEKCLKTFKSIMAIPHEKLSHLFYYCDKDNKYIRNAITQRSKHKFLTIVYFSPKK